MSESRALFATGHYAGAVYLAGYSVECYLKDAICSTLRWDALLATFKTHDLEALLVYSGFDTALRQNRQVRKSFRTVLALWNIEGEKSMDGGSIRYRSPAEIDEKTASEFLNCVNGTESGVVTWLKEMVSG